MPGRQGDPLDEVDAPETKRDFNDFLWMIAHRDVEIYTRRRRWYLMIRTPCRFYDPTRGCIIYPARPRRMQGAIAGCRSYRRSTIFFDAAYPPALIRTK